MQIKANEAACHRGQNDHLQSLQILSAGEGKKGTLPHHWWECNLVQPLWKTVWRLLKKLKIALLYDPAIPHMGI